MWQPGQDSFRDFLNGDGVVLCDGATGTSLYADGVFINRAFEELNLTEPARVRAVHERYIEAGAQVIETNTYAANRFRLSPHGLADQVEAINHQGAILAREAAAGRAWVAGAMGPVGVRMEPFGAIAREEVREVFAEQARALIDAGVDLLMLETFTHLPELLEAVHAINDLATGVPVIAQVVVTADGVTREGVSAQEVAARLQEAGVDGVGVNCTDALATLEGLSRMRHSTQLPLIGQPNAGAPRDVGGRKIYLASAEYLVAWARRAIKNGTRLLGGCCGTSPEHIAALKAVITEPPSATSTAKFVRPKDRSPIAASIPRPEKSVLASALTRGDFVLGVELPPRRGWVTDDVVSAARRVALAGAHFISLPEGPPHGAFLPPPAAAQLCRQAGLETVVHYGCRGRRLSRIQSNLLGAYATGTTNLILVTGDPMNPSIMANERPVLDVDSIGAVNLVTRLNHGEDMGGNPIGKPTAFHIGVRMDPTAYDMERELSRLAWKLDAGAEFIVTSPVFSKDALEACLDKLPKPRVPVIAMVWPLRSAREAEFFERQLANVPVPDAITARMRSAESSGTELAEGLAIAQELATAIKPMTDGLIVVAPGGMVEPAIAVLDHVRGA